LTRFFKKLNFRRRGVGELWFLEWVFISLCPTENYTRVAAELKEEVLS